MNWKKWIKYTVVLLTLITIIGLVWITREGTRMYGGLINRVDHAQFQPEEGPFAITNVSILSPDGERMIPGQTIYIDNGHIAAIDTAMAIPSGTSMIDGSGKYVIPGLIDAHVHLFQSPNDLLLYLANGITEIRELIGEESHLEWRDEIENGRIGPKMFVASPRLGSFGSLEGWFMSWSQGYLNVRNAGEAAKTVQELHDDGYDGIKIYSQLTKESYVAIAKTADSLGMPVFGHIPWDLQLSDIWQYGQSGIAHFEELMNALQREFDPTHGQDFGSFYGKEEEFLQFVEEHIEELSDNLIKSDIAVTSTLWLTQSFVRQKFELEKLLGKVALEYVNPGISEWVPYIPQGLGWLPGVNRYKMNEDLSDEKREAHRKYWTAYGKACQLLATGLSGRGVKIMTGTDANLPLAVPGFSLHDEMGSLNQAGMSASQVLRSATSIPATWLKSNSGKILPGYKANLVLLDKNPLENIEHSKRIQTVIARGRVYDRELLDAILLAVKNANDNSRKINIDTFIQHDL